MILSPDSRNKAVAARFAEHVREYDCHAVLQAEVAQRLAEFLPSFVRPRVLEVGCGTGLFSRHLLERYRDGDFLFTDLAPEMLEACRTRHEGANGRAMRFAVMDGEQPDCAEHFDLIALSMTLQWFSDPLAGLRNLARLLAPGGTLVYATIGPGCFPEWRVALDEAGLRHGYIDMPELPGIRHEERRIATYGSGVAFLRAMRAIGAATPRAGYMPLPPGSLRRALHCLEQDHGAGVTWHIAYGAISPEPETDGEGPTNTSLVS